MLSRLNVHFHVAYSPLRFAVVLALTVATAIGLIACFNLAQGRPPFRLLDVRDSDTDPKHPLIQQWARDIREASTNPYQQLLLAEMLIERWVRYDSDMNVWGYRDYVATVEEIVTRANARGWPTFRDDCDGRAVMLVSLLKALGHDARITTGEVQTEDVVEPVGHAWVEDRIGDDVHLVFTAGDEPTHYKDTRTITHRSPTERFSRDTVTFLRNYDIRFGHTDTPPPNEPIRRFHRPAFLIPGGILGLFLAVLIPIARDLYRDARKRS